MHISAKFSIDLKKVEVLNYILPAEWGSETESKAN